MCCFSRNVSFVKNTRIFARPLGGGTQGVAYQMNIGAPEDLAMILPLPVARDAADKPLEFVNLEKYDKFFDDLAKGFPVPLSRSKSFGPPTDNAAAIEVEKVGSFDASFVPTAKDFSRVDERFRLPDGIWEKLGPYADASFAVFKLREGEKKIHPMAFRFHVRDPRQLFFPTVHVHDGKVHETEDFDHTLYCQVPARGLRSLLEWTESPRIALHFTKAGRSAGLIDPKLHVHRRFIRGKHKNEDIYLPIV
jgi:hypothetical protein